jgi:hypothetical protein
MPARGSRPTHEINDKMDSAQEDNQSGRLRRRLLLDGETGPAVLQFRRILGKKNLVFQAICGYVIALPVTRH